MQVKDPHGKGSVDFMGQVADRSCLGHIVLAHTTLLPLKQNQVRFQHLKIYNFSWNSSVLVSQKNAGFRFPSLPSPGCGPCSPVTRGPCAFCPFMTLSWTRVDVCPRARGWALFLDAWERDVLLPRVCWALPLTSWVNVAKLKSFSSRCHLYDGDGACVLVLWGLSELTYVKYLEPCWVRGKQNLHFSCCYCYAFIKVGKMRERPSVGHCFKNNGKGHYFFVGIKFHMPSWV